jgi:hypothetical protein
VFKLPSWINGNHFFVLCLLYATSAKITLFGSKLQFRQFDKHFAVVFSP